MGPWLLGCHLHCVRRGPRGNFAFFLVQLDCMKCNYVYLPQSPRHETLQFIARNIREYDPRNRRSPPIRFIHKNFDLSVPASQPAGRHVTRDCPSITPRGSPLLFSVKISCGFLFPAAERGGREDCRPSAGLPLAASPLGRRKRRMPAAAEE